jgi:hypothetical protein
MSYVSTRFPLPSVTDSRGRVTPFNFSPARCGVVMKRGVRSKGRTATIRRSTSRTRLTLAPRVGPHYMGGMGGFWSGTVKAFEGAVEGFAAGGPAGAIGGAIAGRVQDAQQSKAKKNAEAAAAAASQQDISSGSGPLANISTATLVATAFGFSALIIVLARGGR